MRSLATAAAFVIGGCLAAGATFQPTLDSRAFDDAVRVGFSRSEPERTSFHQPYRLTVGQPPIDWIDIITPFRRLELEAETRAAAGSRVLREQEARQALGSGAQQVDVIVEMTFHPQNTFVGVPSYPVVLEEISAAPTPRPRARVPPVGTEQVPRFLPRVSSTLLPFPYDGARRGLRGTEPVLGGLIVNRFSVGMLNATGRYDIVVNDGAKELLRARVDFNTLR